MAGTEKKQHRKPKSGAKATKKNEKQKRQGKKGQGANMKAFTFSSPMGAQREARKAAEKEQRRLRAPVNEAFRGDEGSIEEPPLVVCVQGPSQVGKSTVIRHLVKHWSKQGIPQSGLKGPVTAVSGKRRRVTIMEVAGSMSAMVDASKVADLAILVIDARQGFEMETFEFLNMLQAHGMPRVMGLLTNLDAFTDASRLRKRRKSIKKRFQTEVGKGAKLFYFSGFKHGSYPRRDVLNLARFISVAKARPLSWRVTHPYVLVDRLEDLTDPALKERHRASDRRVALYGFLRGTSLREESTVHLCGVGDASIESIKEVGDPCPSPAAIEDSKRLGKRTLRDKERLIYSPMSDLGDIERDEDAVYVHMDDRRVVFSKDAPEGSGAAVRSGPGVGMVKELQDVHEPLDARLDQGSLSLVHGGASIRHENANENEEGEDEDENDDDDEDDEEGDTESEMSDEARGENAFKLQNASEAGQEEEEEGIISWQDKIYGDMTGQDEHWRAGEREDDGDELFRVAGDRKEDDCSRPSLGEQDPLEDEELTHLFVNNATDSIGERDSADIEEEYHDEGGEGEDEGETASADGDQERPAAGKEVGEDGGEGEDKSANTASGEKSRDKGKVGNRSALPRVDELEAWADAMRREQEAKREATRRRLDAMPEEVRHRMEGARPGAYVRVILPNISAELVERFDPRWPLILGGINTGEEGAAVHLARIKRHRWYPKILKNRDPLVVSAGWRRFQTVPIFCMEDDNLRLRSIKYTPEYTHCKAGFFAPRIPPNTPFTAFQSLKSGIPSFRVAATGTVEAQNPGAGIVKKLKLVGEPRRIFKRTCSVSGMFSSDLEASRFQGAKLRTVSGIRGTVKKPVSSDGAVRCSFEDRPTKSDIVFLRAWVSVPVPRFTAPAANLLQEDKDSWRLMRTVAELRRERQQPIPVNPDSIYRPIERWRRKFNPLKVPQRLQADLPYASKPKDDRSANPKRLEKKRKRGVVREPGERASAALIHQLSTVSKHRQRLEKQRLARKRQEMEKEQQKAAATQERKRKAQRKEYFRKVQAKESKKSPGSSNAPVASS